MAALRQALAGDNWRLAAFAVWTLELHEARALRSELIGALERGVLHRDGRVLFGSQLCRWLQELNLPAADWAAALSAMARSTPPSEATEHTLLQALTVLPDPEAHVAVAAALENHLQVHSLFGGEDVYTLVKRAPGTLLRYLERHRQAGKIPKLLEDTHDALPFMWASDSWPWFMTAVRPWTEPLTVLAQKHPNDKNLKNAVEKLILELLRDSDPEARILGCRCAQMLPRQALSLEAPLDTLQGDPFTKEEATRALQNVRTAPQAW
jgi:hypothetical protein